MVNFMFSFFAAVGQAIGTVSLNQYGQYMVKVQNIKNKHWWRDKSNMLILGKILAVFCEIPIQFCLIFDMKHVSNTFDSHNTAPSSGQ